MQQQQQQMFQARLARISDPKNIAWTDPETGMVIPKHIRNGKAAMRNGKTNAPVRSNLGYPLSILIAGIVGALSVIASRYIRFHVLGQDPGDMDPDFALAMDAMMGGAVAFVFREMLKLQGKVQATAQMVGIGAMICLMHNFVWEYPQVFEQLFSTEWVQTVQAETSPQSIYFRGITFQI